jgi:hypothetical protein
MVYGIWYDSIWYMVYGISYITHHISYINDFPKMCVPLIFPRKLMFHCHAGLPLLVPKKNFTVQHHRDSQPLEPHCWTLPGRRSPTWQVIFGDGMGLMGFRSVDIVVRWPNYWNEPSTRMGFALWQQIGGGCQGPSCTCTELLQNTYFFPTFPNPHVSNIKHKSTPNELWVSLNICEYLFFIFFVLFVCHDVAIFLWETMFGLSPSRSLTMKIEGSALDTGLCHSFVLASWLLTGRSDFSEAPFIEFMTLSG